MRCEELLTTTERRPRQNVLPSPLSGMWRVGPSRKKIPSIRIMAEKNRLVGGQIPQSVRSARNQGEGVAETGGFI
jgi:hypothetical protein